MKNIPAGTAYSVNNAFQVQLVDNWAELPTAFTLARNAEVLTIDGPALNSLLLVGGLADGEVLMREKSKEQPAPAYRSSMNSGELAEFIVDTLSYQGYVNVEAVAQRPGSLASLNGLRFDITGDTAKGLNISGKVLMAQEEDQLNAIIFLAPTEFYYSKLAPRIDTLMRTAQLL